MQDGRAAVLVAPPGAGKTTLVPLVLMDEPWADGKILVLEPRRVAARAAARRMAEMLGEALGKRIGLATRMERVAGPELRVEVVTEGLLVRRLQSDPGLEGVACVIFDEAHERNLDTDIAIALCLDVQRNLRPELRLLAMSATLDGAAFAGLLDAPVIESLGRAHAVAIHHRARELPDARALPEAMAGAIREALRDHPGDVLAFLPGWGEIRRTAERLAGIDADVLPLHGELPPGEQDRALAPGTRRKVVLATSIAETSLTVPGVRIVVDGGFRRAPRLDAASGLTRLTTQRISRAAAEQRAGRAGRTEPGVAIRLWTEALHRGLPLQDRPEILQAELSSFALDCAAWGAAPADLALLDTPPAGAWAAARALLHALDALDDHGRITDTGRRMGRLGTHPRFARMMLAARDDGERALAADLAALLEERDPIRDREAPADINLRLGLLHGADHAAADRPTLARIGRAAAQHRRRLGLPARALPGGDAGPLLAAGFPDRIAVRRGVLEGVFRLAGLDVARDPRLGDEDHPQLGAGDDPRLGAGSNPQPGAGSNPRLGAGSNPRLGARNNPPPDAGSNPRLGAGPGARTAANDPLRRAPLLAVAQLELVGTEARIRMAAPLDLATLEARFPERIAWVEGAMFDARTGSVTARRRRMFGPLVLEEAPPLHPDAEALALALAEAAAGRDLRDLGWSDAARQLQARIGWMRRADPAWPDVTTPNLVATAAEWLAPHLFGLSRLSELRAVDLAALLLPQERRRALEAALPARLPLPQGRSAAIDYTTDPPRLEARAQHLFGVTATPLLAGGTVPLHIALLSPAGRPIGITADLAGFWGAGWADARRDMRGRYPRHDWPENPAAAEAPPERRR